MATIGELAAGIIADARLQAARIDEMTREEVLRIRAQTAAMLQEERTRLEQEAQREEREREQHAQALHQLASRQAALARKQELIDEAFTAAAQALHRMAPRERTILIRRLCERARRQMAIGSVMVARQDAKRLTLPGARVKPITCSGGFIAVSKDGKASIDLRFEALLSHARTTQTAAVAQALFEETTPRKATAVKRPAKRARVTKRARPKRARPKRLNARTAKKRKA